MCLRILLGNHQRVCITKLLKSLYPSDHILQLVAEFFVLFEEIGITEVTGFRYPLSLSPHYDRTTPSVLGRLSKKLGILNEDGVYFLLVDMIAIGIETSRPVLIYEGGGAPHG